MIENKGPIGIFDSGVGGLTVLSEIKKQLPCEDIIYLGDTARVPYGIRSAETVVRYSIANADFLAKKSIKLLIIACNTASAVATDVLRQRYGIPIVDVVGPGARKAVKISRNRRVGIIGTEGTIRSGAYQKQIQSLDESITLFTQACPLFVPLAEEGWCDADDEVTVKIADRYLKKLDDTGIDTLVLGCTHYPLLKEAITRAVGPDIQLVDSAAEVACEVENVLQMEGGKTKQMQEGECIFFVTDIPHRFTETGRRFLGDDLKNVHVVDI